jgi:hypothetical protein
VLIGPIGSTGDLLTESSQLTWKYVGILPTAAFATQLVRIDCDSIRTDWVI